MHPRFPRLYIPVLVCCLCLLATRAAAQEAKGKKQDL
jgi:hypothetical protein